MKVRIELNINKSLQDEPFIYYIIKNFNLVVNIVEASFSTKMGWAIMELSGERKEIDRLFSYFSVNNNIAYKQI